MTTPYNTAPMRNKTYFVSDIHLGAVYIANPREHEAKVVRMLQSFEKDCKTLYLLGDILDYWFEYRTWCHEDTSAFSANWRTCRTWA